ncbi:hypothetical protein CCMSSC00406_0009574 [Pleurotus cornucopiae]|uniref:Uncharacterized protein n=1 Tax=Pleurotus cornucopiae TaxID=5321 RepID=A0ACB7IWZ3_PLECO|nr:hypothetical protein CCMSSC00406_0009574 [Pleurotus cornucopiae]
MALTRTQSQELEDLYDAKIKAHFAEIRVLREQRNADCSKTRKIPTELLATIFGALDCDYKHWIVATHVCRTWRNTALNDPTLWADFTFLPRRWIPEVLARSKTALLRVRHRDPQGAELTSFFDYIVEHPERIKILEIERGAFVNRLTKPAPYLEYLSVDTEVPFPPDFLGGLAPRLKTIRCRDLPPEASWLSNLTRLDCKQVCLEAAYMSKLTSLKLGWGWAPLDATGRAIECMGIDGLLSALENIPSLQHLELCCPDGAAPSSRPAPVHLPHLRDITLHFAEPEMADIFNHLSVDNIAKLTTYWRPPYRGEALLSPAMIEPACRFFERCYHDGNLQYLRLHGNWSIEMHRFMGSTRVHTPVLLFKSLQITDVAGMMKLIPRCVPRIFSRRRDYGPEPPLPLTDCDSIEELHIESGYDIFTTDAVTPYPSLRQLQICDMNLALKKGFERITQLKHWIAQRSSTSKIELLVLRKCNLSDEVIQSLQEVVLVSVEP